MLKYIREILIIALVVWIAGKYLFETPEVVTHTVVKEVPVKVEVKAKPEIKWYPKVEVKEDTSKVTELNAVIDSLKKEMNDQIDSTGQIGEYEAKFDSTVVDTGGNKLAEVSVSAISRIPFDPLLHFTGHVTLFNKVETITKEYQLTFWRRFRPTITTAFGYGILTKKYDLFIGVGFSYIIN